MNKKYYWVKLKDDFFKDKAIKKLRKIAGGDTYTIIYLKLLLLSSNSEGNLFFEGIEDSFAEELALELDEDVENVKVTLLFLEKAGLLEQIDEDQILLTQTKEITGKETASTIRSRKHRELKKEQKALQCNTNATKSNTELDIEKEIDKNKISKDILQKNSKRKTQFGYETFELTPKHYAMAKQYNLNINEELDAFKDYHVSKGSLFKDWQSAFNNWLRLAFNFKAKSIKTNKTMNAFEETAKNKTWVKNLNERIPY